MPRINRQPAGYLDLVDAQGGLFPNTAGDIVAPTVDLTDLYLARSISQAFGSFATMAIGDNVVIQIPENEVWGLLSVEFSFVGVLAGDWCSWEVKATSIPNLPSNLQLVGIQTVSTKVLDATGGVCSATYMLPQTLWLPAGVNLVASVVQRGFTARVWAVNYGFYRLRG